MSLSKVEVLKAAKTQPIGIRALAKELRRRPETVISLVKEMEEQGLLEREMEKRGIRGKPRHLIKSTVLGEDYLASYEALELKPLRSRRADLVRAIRDAEYAERLVARGLSPFHLLLELNSLVATNKGNTA